MMIQSKELMYWPHLKSVRKVRKFLNWSTVGTKTFSQWWKIWRVPQTSVEINLVHITQVGPIQHWVLGSNRSAGLFLKITNPMKIALKLTLHCWFIVLQNLSGTIVALINIVCIFVSPNPRTAAIYYFITALFMLLACFDTYFALPLNVSRTSRKLTGMEVLSS